MEKGVWKGNLLELFFVLVPFIIGYRERGLVYSIWWRMLITELHNVLNAWALPRCELMHDPKMKETAIRELFPLHKC